MEFSKIQDFVAETMYATEIDQLKEVFSKSLLPLGFDKHTCVSVVDLVNPPPSALLILNFPTAWAERYIEKNYIEIDPVFQKAMSEMAPFKWPSMKYLDRNAQQIFDEAHEFGICNGVTVPIFLPGQYPATVNVVGDNVDISPENYHIVHLMAIYYHNAIIRIQRKQSNKLLNPEDFTPREIQCLRWAAKGKSNGDIGDILSISHHTVHYHVENVKRKLGVCTRIQAVARAVASGMVLP